MRTFELAALAALVAVALSLPASGRNLAAVDHKQYFSIVDNTTAPAAQTDADGNEVDCSSTLQARCSGSTTWQPIGETPLQLNCPRTESGVEYREPILDALESAAWVCSPLASGAPADAIRGKQVVEVSGTLSSRSVSTLTAQSSCSYGCENDAGRYEC